MINEYRVYEPHHLHIRPVFKMSVIQAVKDLQTRLEGELAKNRVIRNSDNYSFGQILPDFCKVCGLTNYSILPNICKPCYDTRMDKKKERALAEHQWRLNKLRGG